MPITQTSKTVLFERFVDDENRRLDFVLKDDHHETAKRIRDEFTVRSFGEFLKKFPPTYYEQTIQVNGSPRIHYSVEKPAGECVEHQLCNQPFYQAMLKLYEDKGVSGKNNFEFPYEEATKTLGPEYAVQEAKRLRKRLAFHYNEYLTLQARNASDYELAESAEEINRILEQVGDAYSGNNVVNLLPLVIEDACSKLALLDAVEESGGDPANPDALSPGRIDFDENGGIVFLPVSGQSDTPRLNSSAAPELPNLLRQALPAGDDGESSVFRQELMVSVFSSEQSRSPNALATLNRAELENKLESYKDIYKAAQQSFGTSVASLIEKTLNVKAFFDHAGNGTELVVTNCALGDFLKADMKEKFANYFKHVGQEASDEKIWFAIIPAVDRKEFRAIPRKKVTLGPRDDGGGRTQAADAVSFSDLQKALEIFSEAEILTFFNYAANEKTCGEKLSAARVRDYKKAANEIAESARKYAVFAYPNFTLLPERETSFELMPGEPIQVNALYLDAAYVACALTCASQNLDLLKSKGFPVLMRGADSVQPVRFHFELSFDSKWEEKVPLAQAFHTRLNRGGILSWEPELRAEIEKNGGFGFCFCGDEKRYVYRKETHTQRNLYVYRARTLAEDAPEGGESHYRPVFMTLENCYIRLRAKLEGDKIKDLIKECGKPDAKININNLFYSPLYSGVKREESGKSVERDGRNQLLITFDRSGGEEELEIVEL